MERMRQIWSELRGPFVGLITLALLVSLFASGLVSSAQAATPMGLSAHCFTSSPDQTDKSDATKDALCKLCCAVGVASVALDTRQIESIPANLTVFVAAYVRSASDLPSDRPCIHAGGGSRAPPIPA